MKVIQFYATYTVNAKIGHMGEELKMAIFFEWLNQIQLSLFIGLSVFIACVFLFVLLLYLTKRNKYEKAIKLAEEQAQEILLQKTTLNTLFESIPDIIFIKDPEFRYVQCNKSFLEFFNLRREDALGKEDKDCLNIPDKKLEEIRERDRRVINEKRVFVFEEYLPNVTGDDILFEIVKAPLIVNDTMIGIVGIAHEISKIKKLEDDALSAVRTKSMFLANMSHEIRTPMNSIIGFAELAQHGSNHPRTTEYLSKILESSQWLLSIINDILDVSKIESGKIEMESVPFNLPDMIKYCQSVILPKAREKGISLQCYYEQSMERKLIGDPVRLRQVIMNLLSNAVKFTSTGVVKLTASIIESDEKNTKIYFEVKDSGVGISPENISRILEPFMQGDGSITRRFGGTGLGLAISKNIVELMGGTLNVESSIGIGSKFSFHLSFENSDDDNETDTPEITFSDSKRPIFRGEILICEDNDLNREVIYDHLNRVGIKTAIAHNGKEGVDIVAQRIQNGEKPFDLIFMDIQMPVMDGLEASAKIIELGTQTPIVALTANIMNNDIETYRINGLSGYLGKPYTTEQLWNCLSKYLQVEGYSADDAYRQSDTYDNFNKQRRIYFTKNNQDIFEKIVKTLAEGDVKTAHRLAHTLSSNAGHLGETNLQTAASIVEEMLANEKNQLTEEAKQNLGFELRLVLDRYEPLLIEDTSKAMVKIADTEKINVVLDQLEPLLLNYEIRSRDLLHDLWKLKGAEELALKVEEFEFEQAVIELKKFREGMIDR